MTWLLMVKYPLYYFLVDCTLLINNTKIVLGEHFTEVSLNFLSKQNCFVTSCIYLTSLHPGGANSGLIGPN